MKKISYSIVCEDVAHYYFIKRLLLISNENVEFGLDEDCYTRFKCATKKDVINGYIDIANKAFRTFQIELLFVVTDHDDDKRASEVYHSDLHDPLFVQVKEKVIISIPMRAIEHWLRYLQFIQENPASTRRISYEDESRNDSKIQVYGSKKPSKDRVKTVVSELLNKDCISRLISLSPSFNRLHRRINTLV